MEVSDGAVDFADLSLILPFATRIHEFNGVVSGISSAPETRASLQLDGQVAEYGEARVSGELTPAAPKQFSDIQVQFRNLALSPLSPYTATFAGRTIAAGRLNLDLQYRVENGKLNSENSIALQGLKLGDTVDTTLASSLPLEAIVLETDAPAMPLSAWDSSEPSATWRARCTRGCRKCSRHCTCRCRCTWC